MGDFFALALACTSVQAAAQCFELIPIALQRGCVEIVNTLLAPQSSSWHSGSALWYNRPVLHGARRTSQAFPAATQVTKNASASCIFQKENT
ncbi:hypothetical protein ACFIQG_11490 [Comamonas odontotermitis]|uniref:hypothetical protein n=1 Tax=Comamonas odontotermitis TaxID=379895 RepID=UPI0036710242